jgi:hypothetical protein
MIELDRNEQCQRLHRFVSNIDDRSRPLSIESKSEVSMHDSRMRPSSPARLRPANPAGAALSTLHLHARPIFLGMLCSSESRAHVGANSCRTASRISGFPEAALFHCMRLVKITLGEGYADHAPACGRRSDHDLRTQLRWRARTQLTVLLAPPTALMPAHAPMEELVCLMEGIWNE